MKAEMDDGCSEKTETPTSVTDSMQDYLYVIFEIVEEKGSVRAVDIAKRMNFSKPSVHNMIRQLESGGYLVITGEKRIVLTKSGSDVAERLGRRVAFFESKLVEAGVGESTARREALLMSHGLSDDSYQALVKYERGRCSHSE